jgi:hypothetical protein
MVTKWCLIRFTSAFASHHCNLTCPSHGILYCCTSCTSGYHDAAKKRVVQAVDKYCVHNRGAHKKYIHMKCGCCKTLFIGCEVIGKSIQKSDQ